MGARIHTGTRLSLQYMRAVCRPIRMSVGENINICVAFKPPSSISKVQVTSDYSGSLQELQIKGKLQLVTSAPA